MDNPSEDLVRQCLAKNRKYQQSLKDRLLEINQAIDLNVQKRFAFNAILPPGDPHFCPRRRHTLGAPPFQDIKLQTPPFEVNPNSAGLADLNHRKAFRYHTVVQWKEEETKLLLEAVTRQMQAKYIRDAIKQYTEYDPEQIGRKSSVTSDSEIKENNDSKGNNDSNDSNARQDMNSSGMDNEDIRPNGQESVTTITELPDIEFDAKLKNNAKLEAEMSRILSEEQIDFPWDISAYDVIDWEYVASVVRTRSASDCEVRFLGMDNPAINHGPWTTKEDAKLKELTDLFQASLWPVIATQLGTGRTSLQCIQRYQKKLNKEIKGRAWTPEEDARLLELVEKHGDTNWTAVSIEMGNRSESQCGIRWNKSVDPNVKRGQWKMSEDYTLKLSVAAYNGKGWSKIRRHVYGRTDAACRDRYRNALDPLLDKKLKWNNRLDAKLIELAAKLDREWSKISQALLPLIATDRQCRGRWNLLERRRKNSEREAALAKEVAKKKRSQGELEQESNNDKTMKLTVAARNLSKDSKLPNQTPTQVLDSSDTGDTCDAEEEVHVSVVGEQTVSITFNGSNKRRKTNGSKHSKQQSREK